MPPPLTGGFGSQNRVLKQPGVGPKPKLTGGYGTTTSVAVPSAPLSRDPVPTGTSLHMPNLSGPTTLIPPPQAPRKYPDWVYDEKGGVLRFDGNIIVYHIKGFPLCPWQDLVREGPLDPKWDENKAEIAKAQAEEKLNASEPEDEEDDAYVPPGSSQPVPHRKRSVRQQNNSNKTAQIVNKRAYYDANGGGVTEHNYSESKPTKRRRVIKIQKNDPNRQAPQVTPHPRKRAKKPVKWIQCIFCSKWRKIPATIPNETLGDQWACRDNFWDRTHNSCRDPQELESDTEEQPAEPARPTYGYQGFRRDPPPQPVRTQRTAAARPRASRAPTLSIGEALNQMRTRDPEYDAARAAFYKSLQAYSGSPPPVTTLCSRPIDLYHLYCEVTARGGYEDVTDNKQWREIFRTMDNYNLSHTSASYALKKCYRKILEGYERQHFRSSLRQR